MDKEYAERLNDYVLELERIEQQIKTCDQETLKELLYRKKKFTTVKNYTATKLDKK